MARRRKSRIEVSLFPFLSVLVCIIGALTLIIIGTTLGSTAERMETFPEFSEQQVKDAELMATEEQLALGIRLKNERLMALQKRLSKIDELEPDLRTLRDRRKDQEEAKAAEKAQAERLIAQIQQKLRELAAKKAAVGPPATGTQIGVPAGVASKHGTKFRPIWIDCRADGIEILQSGRVIPTARIKGSSDLARIIRDIKTAKTSWCAFMLIRSDGIESFKAVFEPVKEAKIRYGYHPVLTDKRFDTKDWARPDWLK